MRIYSMTATFGKLEHETLTLHPGLNIIEAPNEWGKSTWCAFLIAMLYGIETRAHTTKFALADKERYAPWSGSPMAGRIDLCWNGCDITIERRSKGRSVFGEFRAYETGTGLDVPELTAANCGEMLLGVEKGVFARAGFLRLSDLPVTHDDALRRRLNALVTTGDESGTADDLAQKLRDLKNRCRTNRSNGLIPQALAQRDALESKLLELRQLHSQSLQIKQQQAELEQKQTLLKNHEAALEYAAAQTYTQKYDAARAAQIAAQNKADALKQHCAQLPSQDILAQNLSQLHQLREQREALQLRLQLRPAPPAAPDVPSTFQGLRREDACRQAETDRKVYEQTAKEAKNLLGTILGIILAAASLLCFLIPHDIGKAVAVIGVLVGALLAAQNRKTRHRSTATADALYQKYAPLPPEQWVTAAEAYARAQEEFARQHTAHEAERTELDHQSATLNEQLDALTQGVPSSQCQQQWESAQADWKSLAEAERELQRAQALVDAMSESCREAVPPQLPDTLTYSQTQTQQLLADCSFDLRQLHQKLGICQGRMEALGQETMLQQQLDAVNERIARLEETYAALALAQDTLAAATAALQRRFAPRIANRAQALFGQLTDGRYSRLTLGEDFTVHAGTQDEDTLHSALWRSEGTIDQLYLALRLAVAEELTPDAPLVLDDALARFDDRRLAAAMEILSKTAQDKQVILFTCHSREQACTQQ